MTIRSLPKVIFSLAYINKECRKKYGFRFKKMSVYKQLLDCSLCDTIMTNVKAQLGLS